MTNVQVAPVSQSELLRAIGSALYGRQWYARLSDDLGLNRRRIQRWLAESDPVPDGVWRDLEEMLEQRQEFIGQTLQQLRFAPEMASRTLTTSS